VFIDVGRLMDDVDFSSILLINRDTSVFNLEASSTLFMLSLCLSLVEYASIMGSHGSGTVFSGLLLGAGS
jgi:hypothetical protein